MDQADEDREGEPNDCEDEPGCCHREPSTAVVDGRADEVRNYADDKRDKTRPLECAPDPTRECNSGL